MIPVITVSAAHFNCYWSRKCEWLLYNLFSDSAVKGANNKWLIGISLFQDVRLKKKKNVCFRYYMEFQNRGWTKGKQYIQIRDFPTILNLGSLILGKLARTSTKLGKLDQKKTEQVIYILTRLNYSSYIILKWHYCKTKVGRAPLAFAIGWLKIGSFLVSGYT